MRQMKFGWATTVILASSVIATVGCGKGSGDEENVQSAAQAISKGIDDVDEPQPNAVVKIGGCTGFLLTSTVAISAVHC